MKLTNQELNVQNQFSGEGPGAVLEYGTGGFRGDVPLLQW
jgi:hypothetical protein